MTTTASLRPTWQAQIATITTPLVQALGRLARRLEACGSDEPRTRAELLALARSLERTQPNLAAELCSIALHRPDAEEQARKPS